MATVFAMKNLLTVLAAIFCIGLAVIFVVAIIEQRRVARRQTTDLTQEKHLQKAA